MNTGFVAKKGLLDVFDRIYVINLSYRKDRLREIQQQLERVGLGFDHPNVHRFDARRPLRRGEFPTLGTRGCFESHVGVLEAFLKTKDQTCLILEDDANFAKDFEGRIDGLMAEISQMRWDMIYGHAPVSMQAYGGNFTELPPLVENLKLHFYGVSRRFAAKAVPYLKAIYDRPMGDPRGGAMHVDGAINWVRAAHPDLRTLVALQDLAVQRPSRTDIHTLPWFDRLPVLKQGVAQLRRVKRLV